MKTLFALTAVLLLAGCANLPHATAPSHKAVVKSIAQPAPSIAQTPNLIVKKRWFDRFKKHPTWFHH